MCEYLHPSVSLNTYISALSISDQELATDRIMTDANDTEMDNAPWIATGGQDPNPDRLPNAVSDHQWMENWRRDWRMRREYRIHGVRAQEMRNWRQDLQMFRESHWWSPGEETNRFLHWAFPIFMNRGRCDALHTFCVLWIRSVKFRLGMRGLTRSSFAKHISNHV